MLVAHGAYYAMLALRFVLQLVTGRSNLAATLDKHLPAEHSKQFVRVRLFRRGQPSVPGVFIEQRAILACSALLPEVRRGLGILGYATYCLRLFHLYDSMSVTGAEAVVKDIDFLSKAIEGDDVPVNCAYCQLPFFIRSWSERLLIAVWGVSYGTVLGQYLVKILPPNRVGKIIMDGVVNVDYWSDYAIDAYRSEYPSYPALVCD